MEEEEEEEPPSFFAKGFDCCEEAFGLLGFSLLLAARLSPPLLLPPFLFFAVDLLFFSLNVRQWRLFTGSYGDGTASR